MADAKTQTANARTKSRDVAWRRRYEVLLHVAEVVYEHTGCEQCRQLKWCRHKRPDGTVQLSCMSQKELARTLEKHRVLTQGGKPNWSPTQVKNILNQPTPEPPADVGPLDEFFQ